LTENGAPVTAAIEPLATGFGENTIVWRPNGMSNVATWPRPNEDTMYHVAIENVVVDGVSQSFEYDVTIFDPAKLVLQADFDGNSAVNGADLSIWQNHFGIGGQPNDGDANRNGVVEGSDFLIWQREVGSAVATSANLAVPEPSGLAIASIAAVALARGAPVRTRGTASGLSRFNFSCVW
jgi:hypothetical protein